MPKAIIGAKMLPFEDEKAKLRTAGMRGDIAMAMKKYELAAQFYESYAAAYPDVPGIAEKIALARRLEGQPNSLAPAPPLLPDACKIYLNLC
jgi:hypothetical protein